MKIGRLSVYRYESPCLRGRPHITWSTYVVTFCTGRTVIAWRRYRGGK